MGGDFLEKGRVGFASGGVGQHRAQGGRRHFRRGRNGNPPIHAAGSGGEGGRGFAYAVGAELLQSLRPFRGVVAAGCDGEVDEVKERFPFAPLLEFGEGVGADDENHCGGFGLEFAAEGTEGVDGEAGMVGTGGGFVVTDADGEVGEGEFAHGDAVVPGGGGRGAMGRGAVGDDPDGGGGEFGEGAAGEVEVALVGGIKCAAEDGDAFLLVPPLQRRDG